MKLISTLALLLFGSTLSAQFFNWNKEDTPGHKLFLHGELDYEIFVMSGGLIAEYTSKEAEDDNLINYSLGFKAKRSIVTLENTTGVTFESYYGPQIGIQLGRKWHMFETTINYGLEHRKKIFNRPTESEWISELRLGYRNQGTKVLFRVGIKLQNDTDDLAGIYISFGNRLF